MKYVKKTKYKVEIDFDGKWRIKIAEKETHDQREGSWVSKWGDYRSGTASTVEQAKGEIEEILLALREIKRHEEENADYEVEI
jgi:hypothetical protein